MITKKSERTKVVHCSDNMIVDWDESTARPEVSFYFGDNLRTYVLDAVEDLGKIIAVLCGMEESASFARHSVLVKHDAKVRPEDDGHVYNVDGYAFELAAGTGRGRRIDPDAPVERFWINRYEAIVVEQALRNMCADMMRNAGDCPVDAE